MVQLGALVTLYSSQEDKTSAADVLSKAISWYQNNDVSISSFMQSCVHITLIMVMGADPDKPGFVPTVTYMSLIGGVRRNGQLNCSSPLSNAVHYGWACQSRQLG